MYICKLTSYEGCWSLTLGGQESADFLQSSWQMRAHTSQKMGCVVIISPHTLHSTTI